MLHSKFILEDGNLILGKVGYHNVLVTIKEKVQGGGQFRFDLDKKECLLFAESHEFGRCKMEDVKKAVEEGKVWTSMIGGRNISGDFTFMWDRGSEIVTLN